MAQSLRVIICLACMGIIGIASYVYLSQVVPKKKKKPTSNQGSPESKDRTEDKKEDIPFSEVAHENAIYETVISSTDKIGQKSVEGEQTEISPERKIQNVEDNISKEDIYEFEDQVVFSDEKNEYPKSSNGQADKFETNKMTRSEECHNICAQDIDSKEHENSNFSNIRSDGISMDTEENADDNEKCNDINLKNHSEWPCDSGSEEVDDNLISISNGTKEKVEEFFENIPQQIVKKDDEKTILRDDAKIDFLDNTNVEEMPILVSGSITIDEELSVKHTEKESHDNLNTDSQDPATNVNEEEIEGTYSILGDIKTTNDLIEGNEPLLKPTTNEQMVEGESFNSTTQEEYTVMEKADMIEAGSPTDDETSSSNSERTPTSSCTHVSTFGVWDVQPVLTTEVDEEEEIVSSEKEEKNNFEQKKSKKRDRKRNKALRRKSDENVND